MKDIRLKSNALQEVADVSAEGIIIYSLKSRTILYSNAKSVKLFGLTKDATDADIQSILSAVVATDRDYVRNQFAGVTQKPVTAEVEFGLINPHGSKVQVCCNAYLVAKESAIVVYSQDITKTRQHEDYLVEFGTRKNTVLDTTIHLMSGALNLMKHLSSQAEKYVDSTHDPQLTIYLKLLNDNNSHCLGIIEELLREEHEQSPYISIKNTKFDIIERVSIVHGELQQSYKNRKFVFEHQAGSIQVTSDVVKLLMVVQNFASNAVKFSQTGKPILIRISDNTHHVVFSITDYGIGIPEELRSLIFERQPGAGRRGLNGEKSTGLGLSICKHLMDLLHGKVWFESREGQGSTFFFSVPKK